MFLEGNCSINRTSLVSVTSNFFCQKSTNRSTIWREKLFHAPLQKQRKQKTASLPSLRRRQRKKVVLYSKLAHRPIASAVGVAARSHWPVRRSRRARSDGQHDYNVITRQRFLETLTDFNINRFLLDFHRRFSSLIN